MPRFRRLAPVVWQKPGPACAASRRGLAGMGRKGLPTRRSWPIRRAHPCTPADL